MIELRDPLPDDELLELMQNRNSPAVMEKLVVHNLKLVHWIASRYSDTRPGRELEDLFQEGVIGLIQAIKEYDAEKGTWGSYASLHIKASITRAISNKGRAVRLPVHYIEEMQRFKNKERELIAELGREPNSRELARALNVKVSQIELYRQNSQELDSLDEALDEEGLRRLDIIIDEGELVESEALQNVFLNEFTNYFNDRLTDLQLQGLKLYYGLDCPEHTHREIAELYNVSVSHVSLELRKALIRARESEFMQALDDRTPWIKGKSFDTPRTKGGLPYSPVEALVLERDKMRQQFISKNVDKILKERRNKWIASRTI